MLKAYAISVNRDLAAESVLSLRGRVQSASKDGKKLEDEATDGAAAGPFFLPQFGSCKMPIARTGVRGDNAFHFC